MAIRLGLVLLAGASVSSTASPSPLNMNSSVSTSNQWIHRLSLSLQTFNEESIWRILRYTNALLRRSLPFSRCCCSVLFCSVFFTPMFDRKQCDEHRDKRRGREICVVLLDQLWPFPNWYSFRCKSWWNKKNKTTCTTRSTVRFSLSFSSLFWSNTLLSILHPGLISSIFLLPH